MSTEGIIDVAVAHPSRDNNSLNARLARIPVVDVRDGGPVRHAIQSHVRARTLRDECIRWLPGVAAGLLPAIDFVTRRWLLQSRSTYAGEITAIAAELDFSGIWFLNGCYQWGCTAFAREQDGARAWILRTLGRTFCTTALFCSAGSGGSTSGYETARIERRKIAP